MSKKIVRDINDFNSIFPIEERIDSICKYCLTIRSAYQNECLKLGQESLKLSDECGYLKGRAYSLCIIGFQHWNMSEIEQGLKEVEEGYEILLRIKAYDLVGDNSMVRATIIWGKGEYERSFSIIYDAMNLLEKEGVTEGLEYLYWSLGVFYYDLKDFKKSRKNYQRAYDILSGFEKPDLGFFCYILIGLGSVNKSLKLFDEAVTYFERALETSRNSGHWMEEARSHFEIGSIFVTKGMLVEAEEGFWKSYNMRKEHNAKPGMVSSLLSLADIKLEQGNQDEAMNLLNEALSHAEETKQKPKIYICHQKLADLFKRKKEFEMALGHIEKFYSIKSEVAGEEASNMLKDLETNYATEKSEREKEIHRLKNVELKKAHDDIAEKNNEILDSIKYAKRIQKAILPPERIVKDCLKDSFILYKPKDIVAGDFYWMEQKDGKVFFAVADCTGHGVPGAMVSVVCNNGLNRSVREYGLTIPGKILDKTREIVIQEFEKSEEEVKDGMDIALCFLNRRSLQYAGAHNPLWIIRKGKLLETKADKQPIGKSDHAQPFKTHSFDLEKGDSLYIFSDGYVDQFGGPKGKKFMAKNLKNLLLSIQDMSMEEQKNIIDQKFEAWRGNEAQVDDVCMIGVKV